MYQSSQLEGFLRVAASLDMAIIGAFWLYGERFFGGDGGGGGGGAIWIYAMTQA